MAVGEAPITAEERLISQPRRPAERPPRVAPADGALLRALKFCASLKITVTLFALSILLVLFGTLAQVDYDVWHVVRKSHFRVWVAQIELRSLGHLAEMVVGGPTGWSQTPNKAWVPFPGGVTLGVLLLGNLLAAHTFRFKATAKGSRLLAGLTVTLLGVIATLWVISTGAGDAIKSELSASVASGLWHTMRALLAGCALAGLYWLVGAYNRIRLPEWVIAATMMSLVTAVTVWLFVDPSAQLDDAGMRIMWYLALASVSTAVLLAGCWMIFGKRAGMVLLHAGVGLLMIGELTTYGVDEGQMTITEGETVNYAVDIRDTELAFTDRSNPQSPVVTVVPQRYLENAAPGQLIQHPELPVDLRVVRFDKNSVLARAEDGAGVGDGAVNNPATAGVGRQIVSKPTRPTSGVADAGVDQPSVYVELLAKDSQESLGVYLASASTIPGIGSPREQAVDIGGKPYDLQLRFKRLYKNYSIKLLDFSFKRYPGTNVAKDFRATVRLIDPRESEDRQSEIWMNNPLRYGGDTLYQSSFDPRTEETTVLQVVTNANWMVPYVSCVVVAFGMLAHFGISLGTFLRRRTEEGVREQRRRAPESGPGPSLSERLSKPLVWAPAVVGLVWLAYLGSKARPEKAEPGAMQIAKFAELPVIDGGRIKPYDTVARNTLQFLSARQEVIAPKPPLAEDATLMEQLRHARMRTERTPAAEWMLDVISGKKDAGRHRVFRIENLEVLGVLGLERRPGSFRYSYDEVMGGENRAEIEKQLGQLQEADPKSWSTFQAKMAELAEKLAAYHAMEQAFRGIRLSENPDRLMEDLQLSLLRTSSRSSKKAKQQFPRVVPPSQPGGDWLTYQEAELNGIFTKFPNVLSRAVAGLERFFATAPPAARRSATEDLSQLVDRLSAAGETPAWGPLADALGAYAKGNTNEFNSAVNKLKRRTASYETMVDDPANAAAFAGSAVTERLSLAKTRFEAFFSRFSPFYYCAASYVVAFLLCAASWIGFPRGLGRAATAVIAATFVVHTFAVIARVYISGRPPVTNLYSSAVFIGWAIVFSGLAIEAIFKMGAGSLMASVFGFATLVIAHFMALDGDTIAVLQAVLDTQLWLTIHVLCITLGYAATFVAGGIGVLYILRSHVAGNLGLKEEKTLQRIIYGTLCFAILFSFVGTVLGGLWGDNSWGRFWGWDPKENGALIIVLWNALILHARWGKMASDTTLAALAVAGNVVTTWSWFGVNELGVGLHAYGGLSDGVSLEKFIVRVMAFSQPAIIGLACVPKTFWRRLFASEPSTASPRDPLNVDRV
ncbi:MAG: cytochrome c biogenesis protein CcsA [Planctomycetota bacterium]